MCIGSTPRWGRARPCTGCTQRTAVLHLPARTKIRCFAGAEQVASKGTMIKNHITRRRFHRASLPPPRPAPFPRSHARSRHIRAGRCASSFRSARPALPISRRGSPPRSSATSSGSASWSRTSRGRAGSPLHAPCSPSRPTATRSVSSPTAPRSARRSTRRCRSIRSSNLPRSPPSAPSIWCLRPTRMPRSSPWPTSSRPRASSPASSMSGPSRSAARRTWAPSCSRRQAGRPISRSFPYRGTPDVIVALLRNDIQLMVDFYGPMKPTLQDKKIRPVATSGPQRSPFLADIPTVAEAGVAGYEVTSWNGRVRSGRDAGGDHRPPQQVDPRDRRHPRGEDNATPSSASKPRRARPSNCRRGWRPTSRNGRR